MMRSCVYIALRAKQLLGTWDENSCDSNLSKSKKRCSVQVRKESFSSGQIKKKLTPGLKWAACALLLPVHWTSLVCSQTKETWWGHPILTLSVDTKISLSQVLTCVSWNDEIHIQFLLSGLTCFYRHLPLLPCSEHLNWSRDLKEKTARSWFIIQSNFSGCPAHCVCSLIVPLWNTESRQVLQMASYNKWSPCVMQWKVRSNMITELWLGSFASQQPTKRLCTIWIINVDFNQWRSFPWMSHLNVRLTFRA